jgi:hypothetical protein
MKLTPLLLLCLFLSQPSFGTDQFIYVNVGPKVTFFKLNTSTGVLNWQSDTGLSGVGQQGNTGAPDIATVTTADETCLYAAHQAGSGNQDILIATFEVNTSTGALTLEQDFDTGFSNSGLDDGTMPALSAYKQVVYLGAASINYPSNTENVLVTYNVNASNCELTENSEATFDGSSSSGVLGITFFSTASTTYCGNADPVCDWVMIMANLNQHLYAWPSTAGNLGTVSSYSTGFGTGSDYWGSGLAHNCSDGLDYFLGSSADYVNLRLYNTSVNPSTGAFATESYVTADFGYSIENPILYSSVNGEYLYATEVVGTGNNPFQVAGQWSVAGSGVLTFNGLINLNDTTGEPEFASQQAMTEDAAEDYLIIPTVPCDNYVCNDYGPEEDHSIVQSTFAELTHSPYEGASSGTLDSASAVAIPAASNSSCN